jgi:hypothetical protein
MLGTARPASAIGEPHLDEEQPRQASAVAGEEFPITPAECFAVCFRGTATNDLPPNSTMRDNRDYRAQVAKTAGITDKIAGRAGRSADPSP